MFGDGKPSAAKKLKDHDGAEAGGIVLHQDGFFRLVQAHATNAVDIVKVRNRAHGVFGRMLGVAKLNVHGRHISIINGGRISGG